FGDGTDTTYYETAQFITHVYDQPGNYTVTLGISVWVNGNLISDTLSKQINVWPAPDADFFADPTCAGAPMVFIDSTENINAFTTAWHWNFGTGTPSDTSNLSSPTFSYNNTGDYDVSLVTTNNWGCTDEVIKTVSVKVTPVANFGHTTGCLDELVHFTDLSFTLDDDQIVAWRWNFGDGAITGDISNEQHPSYTYSYLGDKEVELIAYNTIGCSDTVTKTVKIYPSPTAGFYVFEDYENEQGNIALADESVGAEAYYWDFGDGYSVYDDYPPVVHLYEQEGNYLIEQIVWNEYGCTDTARVEYDFMFKTLFIPNALNPNGFDPETMVFQPKGRNLQYFHIAIYNSWGEMLWESSALDAYGRPTESWDGTYEGKLVQSDVYVWKAEAMFKDGTVWDGSVVGHTDGMDNRTSGYVVVVR
ncbi:MAG: PKD domain-containing protein, partial [Bacteroidota bacterium]